MPGAPIRNMGYQPLWLMLIVADPSASPSPAFMTLASGEEKQPFNVVDARLRAAADGLGPGWSRVFGDRLDHGVRPICRDDKLAPKRPPLTG